MKPTNYFYDKNCNVVKCTVNLTYYAQLHKTKLLVVDGDIIITDAFSKKEIVLKGVLSNKANAGEVFMHVQLIPAYTSTGNYTYVQATIP